MNSKDMAFKADTEETSAAANDLSLLFEEFDSLYDDFLLRREFRNIIQKRQFKSYDSKDF